jgi:hypothetical protein
MLTVKELRALASALSEAEFRKQIGPFALIQRPVQGKEPKPWDLLAGTARATAEQISQGVLSLLFEFDELCAATLPPLAGIDELQVGRLPHSDLFIDAPSVSKQHATLKWDGERKRCTVKDLGSTNGTFVDGSVIDGEMPLHDLDIVSFGDEHYWYLLTETLHRTLSRSGKKKTDSSTIP